MHTVEGPPIGPGVADEFTFIVEVVEYVPHAVVSVYITVSRPGETAVTRPVDAFIVARPLVMLQTPPGVVGLDKVTVEPMQILVGPDMGPAADIAGTMVIFRNDEEHAPGTVYTTVSGPATSAVTTPTGDITALPFVRLHVPPGIESM